MIKKDCEAPKPNQYPKSVVYTVVTSSFAEKAPDALWFHLQVRMEETRW